MEANFSAEEAARTRSAAKAVAVSRLNAIAADSSRERNFFVLMKNAPFITMTEKHCHIVSST